MRKETLIKWYEWNSKVLLKSRLMSDRFKTDEFDPQSPWKWGKKISNSLEFNVKITDLDIKLIDFENFWTQLILIQILYFTH